MEQLDDATLMKKGETCIQVSVRRSIKGITLSIKTHPSVEALFKSWGDGSHQDVRNYTRGGWDPVGGSVLNIYNLRQDPGDLIADDGLHFRINAPGGPLMIVSPSTGQETTLNMSFLRLVGISEGVGVSFGVKGVYTIDAIRSLVERIRHASRRIYIAYMRPVDIGLQVFTSIQEVKGSGMLDVPKEKAA